MGLDGRPIAWNVEVGSRPSEREMRVTRWLEELRDDVTFAFRQLKNSPGFLPGAGRDGDGWRGRQRRNRFTSMGVGRHLRRAGVIPLAGRGFSADDETEPAPQRDSERIAIGGL
jgi:hypothetical protein